MKNYQLYKIFDDAGLFSSLIKFNKSEYITKSGVVNTDVYFVKSGSVRIYVQVGYDEQIIRLAYKNNIIAVLDSFFTNTPTDFYIQAIKKTEVLVIKKADLISFIAKDISNSNLWTSILEDMILQQLTREKDLLIQSPKERYERVLQRSPQLFQEIPNKYIANYLRMSPETLSRLKKS